MVVRRVAVVALSGLILAAVASPAAASPSQTPPQTFKSQFNTEYILQVQGFFTPHVVYRIEAFEDIVVVYDGGGPENPLDAISKIEGTVWGLERLHFDHLVIQNGNQAPLVVSYEELEGSLGPRPSGYDAAPLSIAAAFGPAVGGALAFDDFVHLFKVIVAVIGITALLAVLAFGLASYLGSRTRERDDRADRLFA